MAEKDEKTEDQAPAKASGGGLVGLLILALGSLSAAFATVYLLTPAPPEALASCDPAEGAGPAIPAMPTADRAYVELDEVLITIGSAPATRYLKMTISVATGKDMTNTVKQAEPVLIDAFVSYLRTVELSEFEDPGFYAEMRQQLARRAELVLGGAVSDGVLITEFLLR